MSTVLAVGVCVLLFLGMWLFATLSQRLARHHESRFGGVQEDRGLINGAIFALLGLLLAFTFSGAAARLETRRQLIVRETNAISTAYMRLDLLSPPGRDELRALFRDYTVSRASVFELLVDERAARAELARNAAMQQQIWERVVAETGAADSPARMLLLPALNEMFDVTTARTVAMQTHLPPLLMGTLFLVAFACAGLVGYGAGRERVVSRFHMLGFSGVVTFVVYVILDAEYPRVGAIRIDWVNDALMQLAETMR